MSKYAPRKLTAGALVLCYFPEEEAPYHPGPKARPALVLKVFRRQEDGSIWLEVAYASTQNTSQKGATLKPHEFEINPAAEPDSNLNQTTRFDMERRTRLPWNDQWFKGPGEPLPLRPMGVVSDASLQSAKTLADTFSSRQQPYRPPVTAASKPTVTVKPSKAKNL